MSFRPCGERPDVFLITLLLIIMIINSYVLLLVIFKINSV